MYVQASENWKLKSEQNKNLYMSVNSHIIHDSSNAEIMQINVH